MKNIKNIRNDDDNSIDNGYFDVNLLFYQGSNFNLQVMIEFVVTVPDNPGNSKESLLLFIFFFFKYFTGNLTGFEIIYYYEPNKLFKNNCINVRHKDNKALKPNSTIKLIVKDPYVLESKHSNEYMLLLGEARAGFLVNYENKLFILNNTLTERKKIGIKNLNKTIDFYKLFNS